MASRPINQQRPTRARKANTTGDVPAVQTAIFHPIGSDPVTTTSVRPRHPPPIDSGRRQRTCSVKSSAPETPLRGFGTPTTAEDPSRPKARAALGLFQSPWEQWPDSSDRYLGPTFPRPRSEDFTGDEETDFRRSVYDWIDRSVLDSNERDDFALLKPGGICDQLWALREREKTAYW
jgi:hypothetical protein